MRRLAERMASALARDRRALRAAGRRRPYPVGLPARRAGPGGRGPAGRRRPGRGRPVPADAAAVRHVVPRARRRSRASTWTRRGWCWTGWPTPGRCGAAWQRRRGRHPGAARQRRAGATSDAPVQVVHGGSTCRWRTTTGRRCPPTSGRPRWTGWPTRTWRAGVDLTAAPLLRLARRPDRRAARSCWCSPRTTSQLDGWSLARVLADVLDSGHAAARGSRRCAAPFREYLRWLAGRDQRGRAGLADRALAGFEPTPLPYDRPPAAAHRADVLRRAAPGAGRRGFAAAAPDRGRGGAHRQHRRAGRLGAAAGPLQRPATTWSSARRSPAARPTCPGSSRWSACSSTPCRPASGCGPTRTRWTGCGSCRPSRAEARRVRLRGAARAARRRRGGCRGAAVRQHRGVRELPCRRSATGPAPGWWR